jgi:hypothetical protein
VKEPNGATDGGREEDCPAAASLAGLARQLEALDRHVHLEIPRLAKRVELLAETVARVAMNAAARGSSTAALPTATSWLSRPTASDAEPASSRAAQDGEQLLGTLSDWVARVYLRYADARLPDCWLWHPDVIEELLWLQAAWVAAHHHDALPHAIGDWHDRQRPGVVARVHKYAGLCSLEAHLPTGERHSRAPEPPTSDASSSIAAWWATARDQPGPVPTEQQLTAATERLRSRR